MQKVSDPHPCVVQGSTVHEDLDPLPLPPTHLPVVTFIQVKVYPKPQEEKKWLKQGNLL